MKLWRYGQAVEYLGRRYRLDGMLGSGGMADVCLAWDERERREVALKILKSDDLDQETLNRFMKEAEQIAHWQHPHILRIFENLQVELIDATNGSALFYMVSEYARGGDLQKRLLPNRPFPLAATFPLFRQLCDAVQYAHERGVIHRDLKPLNMLFRRPESGPEEVVLSDFGLAVQVDASHHTFAHGGTLAYMAPEQFQGNALPASDIFALGVILYLLCTGNLPFRRSLRDVPRIVQGQVSAPTRPSLLNPELPPALDEVILRALRELPAERYREPREFWEAIELALTMSAPTFPFSALFGQPAGQTRPYETGEKARELPRTSRQESPSISASHADEITPEIEEGPVSALWIAREKQKASPVRLPLPDNSILMPPNPADEDAPDDFPTGPDAFVPPPSLTERPRSLRPLAQPGEDEGELPPRPRVARATRQGISRTPPPASSRAPGENSRPMASASGSTILPGPRSNPHNGEQTSRRNPFGTAELFSTEDEQERQTSRRYITPRASLSSTTYGYAGDEAEARSRAHFPTSTPAPRPNNTRDSRQPLTPARSVPRTTAGIHAPGISPRNPRGRRVPLLAILGGAALLLIVVAILAATTFQGSLLQLSGAPVTKVTLQPRSALVQDTLTLHTQTTTNQTAPDTLPARTLTATSTTQSATVNATGSIPAKQATGQLTFINDTANTVTINSTTITGNSGIAISFNGPVTIPALNPVFIDVPAFAVQTGKAGNIPAFDIDKSCCIAGIVVKNPASFTGGQDAQPNSVVQQKDIDGAARGLVASEQGQALSSLRAQVQASERVVGNAQCLPRTTANQQAGAQAKQVTVMVTVTCSETVYNLDTARQILAQDLQQRALADPTLGPGYTLSGQLALALVTLTPAPGNGQDDGPTLQFYAQGRWAYQFTDATLRQFTVLIAGQSQSAARALLLHKPGVSGVQFSNNNSSLPVNTGEIQMIVQKPAPAPPAPAGTPL